MLPGMNLPNALTVLRILLTLVILPLLFVPGMVAKGVALALFVLASFTDWLDGYLARRSQLITPFGMLWDPIADKILVLGLLIVFVWLELVPAWMVAVIVGRELLVTAVRAYAAKRRLVIPAAKEGKQKAALQMLTIFIGLVALLMEESSNPDLPLDAMFTLLDVGMWVTLALTVWSGAKFVWTNRAILAGKDG